MPQVWFTPVHHGIHERGAEVRVVFDISVLIVADIPIVEHPRYFVDVHRVTLPPGIHLLSGDILQSGDDVVRFVVGLEQSPSLCIPADVHLQEFGSFGTCELPYKGGLPDTSGSVDQEALVFPSPPFLQVLEHLPADHHHLICISSLIYI